MAGVSAAKDLILSGKCSIGLHLNSECHKNTYTAKTEIKIIEEENKDILHLRTKILKNNLNNICSHHHYQYQEYYSANIYKCCDPFNSHKKTQRKNLHIITFSDFNIHKSVKLTPGNKICYHCLEKVKTIESDSDHDSEYQPDIIMADDIQEINTTLEIISN